MSNPALKLRGGASGPGFFPSTPGHVLTIDADGESVTPKPAGGGGSIALKNVLWVSTIATPGGSTFDSIQAAIDSVEDQTPTLIVLAPEAFDEQLSIPAGRSLELTCLGTDGVFAELPNDLPILWTVGDDDMLSLNGIRALGGVTCTDGPGTGGAILRLNCGNYGDVAANITHAVGVNGYGNVRAGSNPIWGALDLTVSKIEASGLIYLENALLLHDLESAFYIELQSPLLGAARSFTAGIEVRIYNAECSAPQTLLAANDLWLDDVSYQQLISNGRLTNTANAVVHLQSPLGTYVSQTGTGNLSVDWSRSWKQRINMTGNVVADMVKPASAPATLTLEVVQGGAAGTLTFDPNGAPILTPGGSATDGAMLTGPNEIAIYVFDWDGTRYLWQSTTAQGTFAS